jgi:biotin carboxyl carrier protein
MKREFNLNGAIEEFDINTQEDGNLSISCDGKKYLFELIHRGKNELVIKSKDKLHRVFYGSTNKEDFVSVDGRDAIFENKGQKRSKVASDLSRGYSSPMPGKILKVFVSKNEKVKKGQVLLILEAMKMETALHAPRDGTVQEVLVHAGSPIDAKDLLVVLQA